MKNASLWQSGSQKLRFCPIAAHGCFVPLGNHSGRDLWGYCIISTASHSFFSPQITRTNLDENSTLWLNMVSSCFGVVPHHSTNDYLQYPIFFSPIGVCLLSISMHKDSGLNGAWAHSPHRFRLSQLPAVSLVSLLYVLKSCGQSVLPFHHNSHFLALPPFWQMWAMCCLSCFRTLANQFNSCLSVIFILFVVAE